MNDATQSYSIQPENQKVTNLLSIDVEDYFQVSAFERVSPEAGWGARELRVEGNTERVLSLLDAAGIKATFFVLGWVAERCPQLVRCIAEGGHEVASHGYGHKRVGLQSQAEFREDVRRSKALLEDLSGSEVSGYRAPSYSISRQIPWAFDELLEAGYRYDSSIFPIRHDFYGIPDWPRFIGPAVKIADGSWQSANVANGEPTLVEVPISTVRIGGKNLPIAGGGYFRLLPYVVTRWGLQRINRTEGQPFVFYLHPWEFDPGQPRFQGAGWKSNFRHYLNLDKTEGRFRRLLGDFHFGTIRAGLNL
ncbi:MAG: polysaccharide deacetylase [Desulfuromonadaceae bacterium GWC2_58_13]|nr:MAG: polysaccharide deacetylase [Desulfuromonadaceae bacterium GWC2_58_13]